MARTVSLAQLRTDARLYADQRPGGANAFITDTELNRLINLKLAELYDALVSARGEDYYSKTTPLPGAGPRQTTAGASDYALPDDFFQLISVKIAWGASDWEEVPRRHTLDGSGFASDFGSAGTWQKWTRKGYQLAGGFLRLLPTPTTVTDYVLVYVPTCPELVNDVDTFDGINGWEKLVTLGVAIEMRAIEQNESADLERRYQEQTARVQAMADERIAGLPHHVIDVHPEGHW
jgi:hypothetical protein